MNSLTPRPYQTESLDALDNHIRAKDTNPCVVIPTGGGKSILIAWTIQRWQKAYPALRVCILAHRKELVEQNSQEFMDLDMFSKETVGVYAAGLKKRDIDSNITFASIDSVYSKWGNFPPFDVIIVDEAHRITPSGEGKYRSFINGCKSQNDNIVVIGFTATPFRMGCGMICHRDHILNEVCYTANVGKLITDGYLCRLRSKVGDVQPDLSAVRKTSKGDYILKSLSDTVDTPQIVREAVRSIMAICQRENRKSIMFFCVDVKHCNDVSLELRKYGINAPCVTGKTPHSKRDQIAKDFKNGLIRAICNVNVYCEGFNAKRVDCIVLLRPTLSASLFIQMVGRGLRLHESKEDCLVLDYAGCIEAHGPIDCIEDDVVKTATCADCGDIFSRAVRACPNCGWEIPKIEVERMEAEDREKKMHDIKAANRNILGSDPEELEVNEVTVHRHRKMGKPDSIRVQYRCGLSIIKEWICLDHDGVAQTKAREWWSARFGQKDIEKTTVNNCLSLFLGDELKELTKSITVIRRGKHTEIIRHNLVKKERTYV